MIGTANRPDRRFVLVLAVTAALASPIAQAQTGPVTDAEVQAAIEQRVAWLWAARNPDTLWENQRYPHNNQNAGGISALAVYALLAAGESPQEERMAQTLDMLDQIEMTGTYSLAIRANIWAMIGGDEQNMRRLRRDVRLLLRGVQTEELPSAGGYTYSCAERGPTSYDNSNSQFAVLGVWAGLRHDIEIPAEYFRLVERHWIALQNEDGSWGYHGPSDQGGYGSMTAAGLATMFIIYDNLHASRAIECRAQHDYRPINRALDWMEQNFTATENPGRVLGPFARNSVDPYYLYAVERAGMASGFKFFADHDWYAEGCHAILRIGVREQQADWFDIADRAFELLFLVRGRQPVLMNQLAYDGDWRNRPRALANFTQWFSRVFERPVSWQIIDHAAPVHYWHDAPVLLITGSQRPRFSPEDIQRCRDYVYQGGVLLSVTECNGREFSEGMRAAYARMFGQYELTELPADHRFFNGHFPIRQPARVFVIRNGIRTLAVHVERDLPLTWQLDAARTRAEDYQFAANIVLDLTDRVTLRNRGVQPWPAPTETDALPIPVARLRHAGQYDPEPLAWQRLGLRMAALEDRPVTATEPMEPTELDPIRHPLAHLTGLGSFLLTPEQRDALRRYCEQGGFLLVDAAGSDEAFHESFLAEAEAVFGDDDLPLLPTDAELYQLPGMEIEAVRRRAWRHRAERPQWREIRMDGRLVGLYSDVDITAGLVGYHQQGVRGYLPSDDPAEDSAYRMMRNALIWAALVRRE